MGWCDGRCANQHTKWMLRAQKPFSGNNARVKYDERRPDARNILGISFILNEIWAIQQRKTRSYDKITLLSVVAVWGGSSCPL